MFRIVAWTKAPRLAALVIVQPDCSGVIPPVPVSWYGVARPVALSGFAGTMMSQLTFAAVVVAGVVLLEAEGLAEAPSAVSLMLAECWPRTTITIPISSASATGMAIVTATRAERLWLLRRRGAGLCPENIQPTSLSALPTGDTVAPVRMTAARNPKDF